VYTNLSGSGNSILDSMLESDGHNPGIDKDSVVLEETHEAKNYDKDVDEGEFWYFCYVKDAFGVHLLLVSKNA
jgi:hypothetical protein